MKIKRICSKCGKEKNLSDFVKDKKCNMGRSHCCKECKNENRRVEYPEKTCPICNKIFIPKMIDSTTCGDIRCIDKLYRRNNPEKQKIRNQKYKKRYYAKEENQKKHLEYQKKYQQGNKEHIKAYMKKYFQNKIKKNYDLIECKYCGNIFKPVSSIHLFCTEKCRKEEGRKKDRIRRNLSSRILLALKRNLEGIAYKHSNTVVLLGCSIDAFKLHLESLFVDNMLWENYGEWHIDHVIPCSEFDLRNSEEQEVCFHYTNLQPLWKADNLSKANQLIYIGG